MRWAIVGFGSISKNRFLPALREAGGTLVSVVTSHPEAVKIDGVKVVTRVADLKDVDVVYIATPNAFHMDQTIECARLGINVFCEKPVGMNAKEAYKMAEFCDKVGITFGVAHMGRFNSYNILAKKILDSHELGEIGIIKASFSFVNKERNKWRYDLSLSGGGAIMDIGIHLINTLRFMLGSNVVEIESINDNLNYAVDQNAASIMKFSNGSIALVDASFNTYASASFEFRGDKGMMYVMDTLFQDYVGRVIIAKDGTFQLRDSIDKNPYVLEIEDMEKAVKNHARPATDGWEAFEDMKVVDAWYESAKTEKKVRIG
ncbi:Gfo/Idh/MocA family protein [Athalassotoga saccharophila]|uniref:Gfo/Idh/MocA family protein n=1 Tax=Athalassotoga saccharophila TaxID=1441386 RepID=UPI0013795565|nr:Gfo/Idh/MocA family oxidoreductase [Athalassotoga saccharophila]BBJ28685.1 1,5-anhydro-D-fructose reductase [Athalassotoga saccharophila]